MPTQFELLNWRISLARNYFILSVTRLISVKYILAYMHAFFWSMLIFVIVLTDRIKVNIHYSSELFTCYVM